MKKIKYDSGEQDFIIYTLNLKRFARRLGILQAPYNSLAPDLNLPNFSKEVVVALGRRGVSYVEDAIEKAVDGKDRAIKKFYQEEFYLRFNDLAPLIKDLIQYMPGNPESSGLRYIPDSLNHIESLPIEEDGTLEVTETYLENIRPKFDKHVVDPIDIELLNRYMAAAHEWNSFLDFANSNGYPISGRIEQMYNRPPGTNSGKLTPDPSRALPFRLIE